MEEKNDKDITTKAKHKEEILKYLAWEIKPFTLSHRFYEIARIINTEPEEAEVLLKELEEEEKIFPLRMESGREIHYMLKADIQLRLLMDIKNSKEKPIYAVRPGYFPPRNWRKEEWTTCIRKFLTGKIKELDIPYYADYEPIRYLLMYMPSMAEWMPFFYKIPLEVIYILFDEYKYIWTSGLLAPNMTCLNNGYLENPKISAEKRDRYKAEFALYQYVLSGRLNEIPGNVSEETPEGMYIHAIYHQYKGEISKPLELYSKALAGLDTKYFKDTLVNLFYTIALINDATPESKRKMETLFKRDYIPKELLPAQLLGLYVLNEKLDDVISYINYGFNNFSPLHKVLISLLVRHFHLDPKMEIKDEDIHDIIDEDHLKLLQLECSVDFAPYTTQANRLKQELRLSPLLPPFQKVDEWERVLALLTEKAKERPEKDKKTKNKSESLSRIVYRITNYNHIVPFLQKSKDGTTWSKGRVISLSTFHQGLPEMNELDRQMATYMKHLPSNWNERERWLLYGPKPLLLLAGYPLVFSEENPNKPLTIQKEEPEIFVTRVKDGFKIKSNVDITKITDNFMMKKEKSSLLRIIELSSFQRDVILIIHRIHLFPEKAEKQLIELLEELSHTMKIHYDFIKK